MKMRNLLRRISNSLALVMGISVSPSCLAQISHQGLSDMGLAVHWESNIGGSPLANGRNSFVVWPHSTAKREHVTVTLGNRVLAKIDGSEIDTVALENAIVKGDRPDVAPRLGLEGAKKKASKLVATYKTLGRQAEMVPFSSSLSYVVTLTTNGILEAIDAESGAVLWQVEAGDPSLPMFGPGVSDTHVVITNGNFLHIYDLETGNQVNSRPLQFSPTGCPRALPDWALVPSVDGRTVGYNISSIKVAPTFLRTGVENRLATVVSADRAFIAGPMKSKLLISKIDNDKMPVLWTAVSFGENMASLPAATQSGYVATTANGTVFHCNTERNDSIVWKTRLATQITKSPVVNKDFVFVTSDDGFLYGLGLSDGVEIWESPIPNINEVMSVGKKHVYARNTSGLLVAFDIATGKETGRSPFVVPDVLPNSISDRIFIVNKKGQLACLREVDATEPTFVTTLGGSAPKSNKPANNADEDTKATEEEDTSMFDGAGDTAAPATEEDPFGM